MILPNPFVDPIGYHLVLGDRPPALVDAYEEHPIVDTRPGFTVDWDEDEEEDDDWDNDEDWYDYDSDLDDDDYEDDDEEDSDLEEDSLSTKPAMERRGTKRFAIVRTTADGKQYYNAKLDQWIPSDKIHQSHSTSRWKASYFTEARAAEVLRQLTANR